MYKAKCKFCGKEVIQKMNSLKRASICQHKNFAGIEKSYNIQWSNFRIRHIFYDMVDRCYNKNNKSYCMYGEKGVKICKEWCECPLDFEKWSLTHGYKDDLTIDRIDSSKDYSPDNCRWVTLKNNCKYKSTTRLLDVDGTIMTGRDWAVYLGLSVNLINKYCRWYGEENTIKFIRKVKEHGIPEHKNGENIYEKVIKNDYSIHNIT